MDTIEFIVSYPFSWFIIILLVTLTLTCIKKYKLASLIGGGAVLIGLSMTPSGSKIWLDSLVYNFEGTQRNCNTNELPDEAILLPGGVVFVNDTISLTYWSKYRIDKYLTHSEPLTILHVPGGEKINDKLEGEYIQDYIIKKNHTKTALIKGTGSHSTYGNFKEILGGLDLDKEYILFTSDWHVYRAFSVAKKMGINVCTTKYNSPQKTLTLKEYPWRFKAAVREYLAIAWYYSKGWI